MKRSLSEWASIAEIFGAIVIAVSLVFVGVQVRASTRATQAAIQEQNLGYEIQLMTGVTSQDKDTVVRYAAWMGVDNSADDIADIRARAYAMASVRLLQDLFLQHEAGTLSEEAWQSRQSVLKAFAQSQGMGRLMQSELVNPDFAAYVTALRNNTQR